MRHEDRVPRPCSAFNLSDPWPVNASGVLGAIGKSVAEQKSMLKTSLPAIERRDKGNTRINDVVPQLALQLHLQMGN